MTRGRFGPLEYPRKLTVRLSEELYIFVETVARDLGINKSSAVRLLLRYASELDPEKIKKYYEEIKLSL